MNNFPYPKGSVWRKWDLQIQTILDDGYVSLSSYYKELEESSPNEWANYIARVGGKENALLYDSKDYFNDVGLEKKERCVNYVRNFFSFLDVFSPELECIGVTDHNYYDEFLLDSFVEYSQESRCKVIAGVEINCGGIHMLLFFPDKLYEKSTISGGIHTLLAKFDIHNCKNADGVLTTTTVDIKGIIDEVKKNGGIVVYPHCNSDNGLFQERTRTDRTLLASIFNHQKVNLLQSRHNESSLTVSEYIKTKADLLTSKFCCHISSDGRALREVGRCDQDNNYLWIKADPTFEGFKQIIYEPEQRIFVGPQKPDDKKPYFVIDQVRFLDNTGHSDFSSEPIEINQNLTTIIGGKSTGKSLLLHYMAKTIDPQEVEYRNTAISEPVAYDFDDSADFNFEVTWKDGQRIMLAGVESDVEEDSQQRKILYVPQKYLNTLSETNIKSRDALNQFVLSVILQDRAVNEKYHEAVREIGDATKFISTEIGELFSEFEKIRMTEEELKETGDEKGIESYIETLRKQTEEIKGKSGLSEEELTQYEVSTARDTTLNNQLASLAADRRTINDLRRDLSSKIEDILSSTKESEAYLNDSEIRAMFRTELKVVDSFAPAVESASSNIIAALDARITASNDELVTIQGRLAPLLAKVQLQSVLQEKTDAIKQEQQKLNELTIKRNSIKTRRAANKKKAEAIIEAYKQIFAKYEYLRNEFKKFESKFGDITLGAHVGFYDESFNSQVVGEYLNKNDLKRVIPETEWGEEFVYQYEPAKHLANITTVFQRLVDGTISTIKGRQSKDAAAKLLEDYFYCDFRVFYRNDSLDKMSPGKKGLVLLQLLINLSNEEWPILLDQPEDDLDNRSVYCDLVDFLKRKKLQRQIVIVTHNPNLVVGADSEETIVSNQSGQEVGRDNRKYRFEYVSGALENTFELEATEEPAILYREGIRQHVCEILEGGKEAFQKREQKYSFPEE